MKLSIFVLALFLGGALTGTVHGVSPTEDAQLFTGQVPGDDDKMTPRHLSDTGLFSRGDIIDTGVNAQHPTGLVFEDERPGRRLSDDASFLRGNDRRLQTEGEIAVCCAFPLHNLLVARGYDSTFLPQSAIIGGALLEADGSPKYSVLVLTRFGVTTPNTPSLAFLDKIADYAAAGGNFVTEYDGGVVFFSELASRPFYRYLNTNQLGIFDGIIRAGYSNGYDTPIDIVDPLHPTTWGLPNPFSQDNGTEFFFWVEDPDPSLSIIGIFEGNGGLPFPSNETLPTLLSGCKGNSTFVFAFWDYQDKFTGGPNEVFFLNAVNYVLDPFSCLETEAPSTSPTDLASASPTEFHSTSPTVFASEEPTEAPSNGPTTLPSGVPSLQPSASPSVFASNTPTLVASESPTVSSFPSLSPSDSPTISAFPSQQPSDSPTISVAPSASPSCTPLEIEPLTSRVVFVNGTNGAPSDNGLLQVNVTSGEDLTYSWTTTCAASFSDATIANPILSVEAGIEDEICEVAVTLCGSCGVCESLNGMIVVIDPFDGFAAGAGSIESPPGAYPSNPSWTGKANYCFVSKYKPFKSEPSGQADFKFHIAGLEFESTAYEWLVVTDDLCAQIQGVGTISGSPGYAFLISACDYGPSAGMFGIKIWSISDDSMIYDNGGTVIASGNIHIEV